MCQTVAMEKPTCIARLVQFKVVAVAMQPRFHHSQHLNEVTIVRQRCTVGHQCKMAELVEVSVEVSPSITKKQKSAGKFLLIKGFFKFFSSF